MITIEKTLEGQNKSCAYCCRGTWNNPERISWQDSKDCFIRNSTTPSTGSRVLRLQNVTFTGNWLPVEYWEYIHNNNDIDKNNEKDDDDDDDDDSGRQEKTVILISRLSLRMRRMKRT